MKVTILGFTIPDPLLYEINRADALMYTQTHRFAWSLVRALKDQDTEVDLLSVAPVSDYPRNPRLMWRGGRFEQTGVHGRLLPFVNATGLKHLTRFLAAWTLGLQHLLRVRPDWILVHGVHTPFLWFAVCVAGRIGARACIVMTDPPGVVRPEDNRVRAVLKRLDIFVARSAINRADAVVVLAEPLARDFAPAVPSLVMEGLSDPDAAFSAEQDPRAHSSLVVYAGGLHDGYGVRNLVDAVRMISDVPVRLALFGRGPLESWAGEVADRDPRVVHPRLVTPDELPAIYRSAAVLVQPRQVDQDFVRYSFPSKLIEYMASATPVVTTKLPSIPGDYGPYVLWAGDEPERLAEAIRRVLIWPAEVRREFGDRAATFISESRSTSAQGRRIVEFLRAVEDSGRKAT